MNKLVYLAFSFLLVACGEKAKSVEVGSKENFEKGQQIQAERNRELRETNKIFDQDIKSQEKQDKTPPK